MLDDVLQLGDIRGPDESIHRDREAAAGDLG